MLELIFATTNPAKLAQLAYVIEATQSPVRLVSAWERYGDLARYLEQGPNAASIAQHGALDIAQRVGRGATITAGALYALKCAGYIHFDRNARNARTILLPFGETVVHPAPQEGQRDA